MYVRPFEPLRGLEINMHALANIPLANILGPYLDNWILIAIVALLLFGKRLPEVGRSLGKGIIEFKKGLAGIEEDVTQSVQQQTTKTQTSLPPTNAGFKFDPYTGKPVQEPATPQMRFDPYTGKPLADQASQPTSSNT
jgi:sec-independent protein translocase protein TatA